MKKGILAITVAIIIAGLVFYSCASNSEQSGQTSQTIVSQSAHDSVQQTQMPSETAEAEIEYRRISPETAYAMMAELESFILLDVRTEAEFREKYIEGAILIPSSELAKRAERELPDRNQVILLYCQSGRRSANAANQLISMGYTNVYDFGGIGNWPYDIVIN